MHKMGAVIKNIESYIPDLWADIYMGWLRADKENDILMELGWNLNAACNSRINIDNAIEHYPLADFYYDDEEEKFMASVKGGCRKYHDLIFK